MTQDQKDKFKDWLNINLPPPSLLIDKVELIIRHVDHYYSESPDSNQEEQKNIWLLALDYLIDKMRYWRDNNMQSNIDEVVDYYKSIYIINKK